jgi:hypothetical protein
MDRSVISPPVLPIPGTVCFDIENSLAARASQSVLPSYVGDTFPAICEFWVIFQQMTLIYFPSDASTTVKDVPLLFAEHIYRRFLDWSNKLGKSCMRVHSSPHHVLVLQ